MHKEKRNTQNILIGNLKDRIPERLWRNMKINVKEISRENAG
jgi:hypothetical protein